MAITVAAAESYGMDATCTAGIIVRKLHAKHVEANRVDRVINNSVQHTAAAKNYHRLLTTVA